MLSGAGGGVFSVGLTRGGEIVFTFWSCRYKTNTNRSGGDYYVVGEFAGPASSTSVGMIQDAPETKRAKCSRLNTVCHYRDGGVEYSIGGYLLVSGS